MTTETEKKVVEKKPEVKTKAVAKIKAMDKCTLKELVLIHPRKQFVASGGTEKDFIREAGFALQLLRNNPYLQKMDKQSIIDSVANVALLNLSLSPELRQCYLIPRKGKLYCQSSYMGKKDILIRAGNVKDVWATLVYEGEEFIVEEGSNRFIKHTPKPFGKREKIIGGFWCAVLSNGQKPFGMMTIEEIQGIQKRSEAVKAGKGSPWDSDFEEMAKKTILNRAFKSLPKTGISKDILKVLEVDNQVDNDINRDLNKMDQDKAEGKPFFEGDDIQDAVEVKDQKPIEIKAEKETKNEKTEEVPPELIANLDKLIKAVPIKDKEKVELIALIPEMNINEVIEKIEELEAIIKPDKK